MLEVKPGLFIEELSFEAALVIVSRDKHRGTRVPRLLNPSNFKRRDESHASTSLLYPGNPYPFFVHGIIRVPLTECVYLGPFGDSSQCGHLCRACFRASP